MKIELCSGKNPRGGFVSLDKTQYGNTKIVCDLNKESLPFKDNSIDEFYEQNSFYELENPMQVIRECYRCLKPNGILEFKEMHFSSQYAYLPYTKNFWGFNSRRLFEDKNYRENWNWKLVKLDFETGYEETHPTISFIYKSIIKLMGLNFYEKFVCRVFPIFRVHFVLQKAGV